jgi:hypothetical protein
MGKKKNKEPEIRQPDVESQRWYQSLRDNDASMVKVRNKRYKLRWLKPGQIVRLGRLLLRKRKNDVVDAGNTITGYAGDMLSALTDDQKLLCKTAAIFILDGYWKIKFRYWYLWRWFYYIKQYDSFELEALIAEGKKKVPLEQFLKITMFLTGAKDTLMMMRTEEAERILRELSGGASTASASPSEASATQGTSSSA